MNVWWKFWSPAESGLIGGLIAAAILFVVIPPLMWLYKLWALWWLA